MPPPGDDKSPTAPEPPDDQTGGGQVDSADDLLRPIVPEGVEDDDDAFESDPGLPQVTQDAGPEPTIVPPRQEDLLIGCQFGGYEITEKIGHGGMGTVYKGKQVSLDRTVAIKILNAQLVNNAEFIRRFEREAKSIARISHPNIVAVHDFGQSDGYYYMVIEYVDGTNLSRLIAEKLVLTPEEFIPILIQCLDGLEYVARTGTVHRDIKPDNILITEEGIAKIADFGLAKNTEATGDTDLTAHGSAMGTPAYMSPEQCMGRQLDFRSDIYGFGVTAYFALTGEKPFVGNSSFEIMTKHREYLPPPPSKLNPQLAPDISDAVMRMLAKDPNDRYRAVVECRDQWIEVAERHGILSSGRKSGEWPMPDLPGLDPGLAPVAPSSTPGPGSDRLAAIPSPVEASDLAPMLPDLPDLPEVPDSDATASDWPGETDAVATGPGSEVRERPPTERTDQVEAESREPGSERRGHHDSERVDGGRRRASGAVLSRTCTACGMLNKVTDLACQRCGEDLVDPNSVSFESRLTRAEELMAKQRYQEAAQAFAKLADSASDRRQRSVMRSREREARTLYEDHLFDNINQRCREMVQRGDIGGGIQLLERGLDDASSAASATLTARISGELSTLRQRRRRRWRRWMLVLFMLATVGGLGAVWYYQHHIPGLGELLPPWLQRPPGVHIGNQGGAGD